MSRHGLRPLVVMLLLFIVANICGVANAALKTYRIGGTERPWATSGVLTLADVTTQVGWIQPLKMSADVNIINALYTQKRLFTGGGLRGEVADPTYRPGDGRMWSPNAGYAENRSLLQIADGLKDSTSFSYFNRLTNNNGVTIYIDLGATYPVSQIRFYPLGYGEHADLYLKGYEIYVNDGRVETQDKAGQPIYRLLVAVPGNQNMVVDERFSTQHVRYIKLRSTHGGPFEIDQLEVRGEGYVREATFVSNVIDLGEIANLGTIQWDVVREPAASARIETRIGTDATTMVYYFINDLGEPEELNGLTDKDNKKAWDALPDKAKGPVQEDIVNWSLWSVPYDSSGQPVFAEGPRRYLQVRVSLLNETGSTKTKASSVSVQYSQPVIARQLLGEIRPRREVPLGATTLFTYRVWPVSIEKDDTGYDVLEIITPVRASVRDVGLRGKMLPSERYSVKTETRRVVIQLLDPGDRIAASGDTLSIFLDSAILSYGAVFRGRASWSRDRDMLGQTVEEQVPGSLAVRGAESSLGRVLGRVDASPNPFTPNGDGIGDVITVAFKVFQMIGSAPVEVKVYNLSGACVRELLADRIGSGEHSATWDGRDRAGAVVSPGLYVLQVSVKGGLKEFVTAAVVAVAY